MNDDLKEILEHQLPERDVVRVIVNELRATRETALTELRVHYQQLVRQARKEGVPIP